MTTTNKLAERLHLTVYNAGEDREISNYYIGDLLSWVMGRCGADDCWLTVMNNVNVLAVAKLTDCACVVLCEGVIPDQALIDKAVKENICLLGSTLNLYELARQITIITCCS